MSDFHIFTQHPLWVVTPDPFLKMVRSLFLAVKKFQRFRRATRTRGKMVLCKFCAHGISVKRKMQKKLCAVDNCAWRCVHLVNEFSASLSEKKCRFFSYFISEKTLLIVISSTPLHRINESKHFSLLRDV